MRSELSSRGVAGRRAIAIIPAVAIMMATLVLAPAGALHQFPDVETSSPFHDDVAWLVDSGYAAGFADGTFRPTAPVSRQAMAAFVHDLAVDLGAPAGTGADPGFTDVPASSPFLLDISWMVELDITGGYSDGTFRPTAPVSRQAMAAFLRRVGELVGGPSDVGAGVTFTDVSPASPFHDDIGWVDVHAIAGGYPDGTFRPSSPVSRQAMAAFLRRLDQLVTRYTYECSSQSEIPLSECEALSALYFATDGTNWGRSADWLTTATPCSWFGVACTEGRVTSLSLYWNRLVGTLPSELGDLTALTNLRLDRNEGVTGSIPSELGQLTELESLHLSTNDLTGTIPPELGNLTKLRWLSVNANRLAGTIPPELGNLSSVEVLSLEYNTLSGSIPTEIGNLLQLKALYLGHNEFDGSIPPELGDLVELESLGLAHNALIGSLPPDLGALTKLRGFSAGGNALSGEIPITFGALTSLTGLQLEGNELTGTIPSKLGGLTELYYLDLSNNHLVGSLPPQLGGLRAIGWLMLQGNDLSGAIPSEIGELSELGFLYLDGNELTGSIPASFSVLSDMQILRLHDNELSGVVPEELGALTLSLDTLTLAGNGCLIAATPSIASWLSGLDPGWDDGC